MLILLITFPTGYGGGRSFAGNKGNDFLVLLIQEIYVSSMMNRHLTIEPLPTNGNQSYSKRPLSLALGMLTIHKELKLNKKDHFHKEKQED